MDTIIAIIVFVVPLIIFINTVKNAVREDEEMALARYLASKAPVHNGCTEYVPVRNTRNTTINFKENN